jgi:hypothetical protein
LNAKATEKHWKSVWSIKAPGKMIIHLWRFAHDCLPSGFQLMKRRVPDTGPCVFCDRTEDIVHAMLTCQFARVVWREVKQSVHLRLNRKNFSSHRQWLFDFLESASELQATTLAVAFWHIWEARNTSRNTADKPNPTRTVGKILAYVDLIRLHLYKQKTDKRCVSVPVRLKWTPPPPGSVLVNSDAAIFKESAGMAAGVIIRDHLGTCIAACRQYINNLPSPEYGEAIALRRAVLLARDRGLDKAIFASDCLSLVQRMDSSTRDRSSVGILVDDIKHLVKDFNSVSFFHVRRELNVAAHVLAKSCFNSSLSEVFLSVPDCIRQTLCIDVI